MTPDKLALCQRIQAFAIRCETHHVFVSYAGHVDLLTVRLNPINTDYQGDYTPLIDEYVFLNDTDAESQLQGVLGRLGALVGGMDD